MAANKLAFEMSEEKRNAIHERAQKAEVTDTMFVKRAIETFIYLQDLQASGVELYTKAEKGTPAKLVLFM